MGRFDTVGKLVSAHLAWRHTLHGGYVSGGRQQAGGGPPLPDVWPSMASVRPFSWNWSSSYYHTLHLSFAQLYIVQFLTIFDKSEIVKTMTMTMIILETCGLWDIDYNSDNWELEFMTIFVTWQLRVTLDSIHNSCDVFMITSFRIGWEPTPLLGNPRWKNKIACSANAFQCHS